MPNRLKDIKDTKEAVFKLCEGNPGALTVLLNTAKYADEILPLDTSDGATFIAVYLALDKLDIVGPRIWMLYKDVCKCKLAHFIGILALAEQGAIPCEVLNTAIDNYGKGLDVESYCQTLQLFVPKYQADREVS